MIKLSDIKNGGRAYLKQNPDFANELVAILNKVDAFSLNKLEFFADSLIWTYDCWFSPHYEIEKETFVIENDQIEIYSTNREDLLNLNYYQHLNELANNYPIKKWRWSYFPQNQVLQLGNDDWIIPYLNIKLTKPIDQYDQKQINAMGKFMTDVHHLIVKDDELDWEQLDEQWKQGFDNVKDVGIVFDLNDFTNPKILLRWWDENEDNHYKNDLLKQVFKADSPLLKFLDSNDFQSNFLKDRAKINKVIKKFLIL